AERVLLGGVELRHRAPVAAFGHEHGVVAETAAAQTRRGHPPFAASLDEMLESSLRIDVGERADVAQPASRRHLADQQLEVLLVARALPGEARRANPGRTVERCRRDPRI